MSNSQQETGVEWDDVAGLEEAKAALREAIEGPIKHAALYAKYGKRPSKGALLYGPPGCGKTLLGKASAHALKVMHAALPKIEKKAEAPLMTVTYNNSSFESLLSNLGYLNVKVPRKNLESESGFIYVKGPAILNKYVGESEAEIRRIFSDARAYKKNHGYPAVIFVDEAEAILCHRSKGGSNGFMAGTIVPAFLAEMDGFDDASCFVLLATNRPDDLDPAIIREGRIDRKIGIARPDEAQAAEVFRVHLRKRPSIIAPEWCAAQLYAAHRVLYKLTFQSQKSRDMTLGQVMSGAAIAMLVDRACESAINRDIAASAEDVSGIGEADMLWAIDQLEREHRGMNHSDDLFRLVEEIGESVALVRKAARDGTFADLKFDEKEEKKRYVS